MNIQFSFRYQRICKSHYFLLITRKEKEEYKDFRRRCNSFFMEVVSKLCFGTGTKPSTEVLDKLLTYITGIRKSETSTEIGSKELTVFDDCVDQAPVIRSFILQQIMLTW